MPWSGKFVSEEEFTKLERQLPLNVRDAWEYCVPIWLNSSWADESWASGGRVNDMPPGLRRVRYTPSMETTLGWLFVQRFAADYAFLLERPANGNAPERLCAFDLLVFLARDLYSYCDPLPSELKDSTLPMPAPAIADIEHDWIYKDLRGRTLGHLLSFEHNGQSPLEDQESN